MITTTVLEPETIQEIARIGHDRKPAEACGIVLPTPLRGRRVWEVPNRSMKPQTSFEISSEDLRILIQDWLDVPENRPMLPDAVIWHTHPGGGLGPSKYDMRYRFPHLNNLVVTLGERPEDAKPTWF